MYEAIDISLRSGQKHILKNVSLTIKPGQFTSVVGPNGAGKSSLIKIMSNEQNKYSGNVVVNGSSINRYKAKELSQIRAVMAQHVSLQFTFTTREVIALSRHAHLTSRSKNQNIID